MFRLTHSLVSFGPSDSAIQELRERRRDLGSRFIVDSENGNCSIGLELPRGNLATALEILSVMVTNPSFDPKRIERAKRELRLEYADGKEGSPRRAALKALRQPLFCEPVSLAREGETLRTADTARVEDFYRKWFNPGRATLVVAADTSADSLRSTLESMFGTWSAFGQTQVNETAADSIRNAPVYVIDRPGAEYAVIVCAAAITDSATVDYQAVEVMAEVLNSRVSQRLRAREQLSYEAIAFYEAWPRNHVVTLLSDARYDAVHSIIKALRQEIGILGSTEPFAEVELSKAREALAKRVPQDIRKHLPCSECGCDSRSCESDFVPFGQRDSLCQQSGGARCRIALRRDAEIRLDHRLRQPPDRRRR